MNKKTLLLCACLLACLPALSGCTATSVFTDRAHDFFLSEDVNLIEKNYAAADYLAGLTHATLSKYTPIEIGQLAHANKVGLSSAFGSLVPEQVGARMAQLGYTVVTPERGTAASTNRGAIITGTYLPNGPQADINLRIVNKQSGQIIGAFDYNVPINSEIGKLLEERPTATKVDAADLPEQSSIVVTPGDFPAQLLAE